MCRCLLWLILLLSSVGSLFAQDTMTLKGITVSAARSNPLPLTTISKKEMEQHVNNNIIDAITKGVPGVSAVTTGPNISKPFIRGLGYNRVLTLYDGVRQEGQQWGDEHGIEADQYGIGRVEVVKGPASLTYGSDALAGVIIMKPDMPEGQQNKLTGNALLDYHTNNGMAGASLGLVYKHNDWRFAGRFSEKLAHDYRNAKDGYIDKTAFRETNGMLTARADKSWGFSQWSATIYNNEQEIPDSNKYALKGRSYIIQPLHQHIQHYRLYTNTQWKHWRTTLGWQRNIRQEYSHPDQPAQPGMNVELNTFNYDIRYYLSGAITTGVNGMYQQNHSRSATDFPIPDYGLFDIGGFFLWKQSFDKVDVTGGLRYDHRSVNWNDFYIDTTLQFSAFTHQYTGISGSLGLTWNISERILLKANIARGYRAPNITEIGSNGLDPGAHIVYLGNREFKPEFSLQEDLGLLAYLKDADVSLELFNNNIANYIYQARLYGVVIVPGNDTYKYQQSRAQLYGGELAVNLHPVDFPWLSWRNSLAYTEGLNRNKELISEHGEAAKYLPLIPPLHGRSELQMTYHSNKNTFGGLDGLYLKLEADAYSHQAHFYGVDNSETFTKGYVLINIGTGATIKDRYEVFLQADNLFNKTYQSNMSRLKYLGIYNMGRNISLKLIVRI
jgi:iron complex outermembrane recepter protein